MFLAVSYPYSLTFSIIFFLLNTLLLHDTIGGEKKVGARRNICFLFYFSFGFPPTCSGFPDSTF